MSIQARYGVFVDPYNEGFAAGRRNVHTCGPNYTEPEHWIAWLKGWREGQKMRGKYIERRDLKRAVRRKMQPARVVREYYARLREISA